MGEKATKKDDIYKKARKWSIFFLENFDFIKPEDIIRIKPKKEKDKIPVFFSPGWGIAGTSKAMMQAIADEGRNVISTFFTREQNIEKEEIPGAELQKALAIIEIVSKNGTKKIDAIGHSEGGLALALAACIRPDLFRNIVLIAPAGMMKKDSFLGLIVRFALKEPWQEIKSGKMNIITFLSYIKGISIHVASNLPLSIREVKAMNKMDIFEMTKYLKEQGVGVGLVCGATDQVFPIEEVLKNANEENIDCLVSTKGNHGLIILGDDYKEYIALAENILIKKAKKKKPRF